MKRMTKIGIYGMAVWLLSACGNGTPDYDATGTFEATEVIVSAEAAGKLLQLEVEEGTRLKAGEEVGLVDTVQLYLKKLQLEASMKSVESQRPDLAKQIAATKQQITTDCHFPAGVRRSQCRETDLRTPTGWRHRPGGYLLAGRQEYALSEYLFYI